MAYDWKADYHKHADMAKKRMGMVKSGAKMFDPYDVAIAHVDAQIATAAATFGIAAGVEEE